MLHERNVNNLRYILLVNGPSQYAYFDDARMSIIIKGIMLDTKKMPSFSTLLKGKNCLIRRIRIRIWTSKTCSCRKHDLRCTDMYSQFIEICENRNLNVMTEDNGEES